MKTQNTCFALAVLLAIVVLGLAFAVAPGLAQNVVPPTAREAAASPAFAAKLHPRATAQAAGKSSASARARTRRPLPQDGVIYENGPVNGNTDAWTINFGYVVADSFTVGGGDTVTGFDFWVWEFPGDSLSSVDWSITSAPFGGTTYSSGTASGSNLTDTYISSNSYGYNIDQISASGLNVALNPGTYYLNLANAAVPSGDPVYWDENSGVGCNSPGCPSLADQNALGTIPSEAFDVTGGTGTSFPPCFGSSGNMQIIHDFNSKTDGGSPSGGVVADPAGKVYGPMSGGQAGYGFVYQIASKNQSWVFSPLYNFTGGSDGQAPGTPIIGPGGVLYGIASGGKNNYGLVYSLRPAPAVCLTSLCSWTESSVYQFTGSDGVAGPANLIFDQAGNLYSTSASGGAYGQGAVFELMPSSSGWTETILYSFTGGNDGGGPSSLLVGIDGNLYGTTLLGGASGDECSPCGVVFQLVRPPSGGSWTENVIYSFTGEGNVGGGPYSLAQDGLGNLLGVAAARYGGLVTLFELSPSSASWVFSVIDSFGTGIYAAWADSDLVADAAGNVYWAWGAAYVCHGGDCQDAANSAVEVWPPGGDFSSIYGWKYGDGLLFLPNGTLGLDAHRRVYGTTASCGKYGQGTVWMVTH